MNDTPEPIPGPAYRIHTPRLVVRCWDPADAPLMLAAVEASREHLRPWMPWAHETLDLQGQIDLLRRFRGAFDRDEDYVYGILNRAEMQVWGGSGLHTGLGEGAFEIGYWIHAGQINRGLATEMAGALTRVAVEVHHVDRIEIHCDPRNVGSAAVARKLGYAHEATLRRRVRNADGGLRDMMVWTLFAADYPTSSAARLEIEAFDALGRRLI